MGVQTTLVVLMVTFRKNTAISNFWILRYLLKEQRYAVFNI